MYRQLISICFIAEFFFIREIFRPERLRQALLNGYPAQKVSSWSPRKIVNIKPGQFNGAAFCEHCHSQTFG